MSKVSKILSPVLGALGLNSKAPEIKMPEAQIPAPPAPVAPTDTGASVSIGTSADIKNQRVSGRSTGRSTGGNNFLAGLGRGGSGLSI